jgi:motility quorum-sensing regulator / GCU-specific mRNA interferase toxin
MSEKRKPTYDLEAFKTAFDAEDKLQIAGSALKSAARIGFGRAEIVATIQTMRRSHFYKSTTAYADNRLWQDVSTTSRPRPERFT